MLRQSNNVMSLSPERTPDSTCRDVGVEQDSHRSIAEAQERIELAELFERSAVPLDEGLDLIGKTLCVGLRETQSAFGQTRVVGEDLRRVACERFDDGD